MLTATAVAALLGIEPRTVYGIAPDKLPRRSTQRYAHLTAASLSEAVGMIAQAQRLTQETGISHHVDHVIPLQGRLVSGLHVHTNMQIITGSENSRKWNRWAENPAQGDFAEPPDDPEPQERVPTPSVDCVANPEQCR